MNHKQYTSVFTLLALSLLLSSCGVPNSVRTDNDRVSRPSNSEMRMRQNVVEYAARYLGTKYKYAGKKPSTGFDCSGFTGYVMKNFGVQLSASAALQENQGVSIPVGAVNPGDLIFFRRSRKGRVFHVALVADNTREGIYVIHAASRGVIRENISKSAYWMEKVQTARNVVAAR